MEEIKNLLEKDQLDEVIIKLKKYITENDLQNQILLNSARNSDIKRMIRQGIVSFDDALIEKNKIRLALIEIINEIETTQIRLSSSNKVYLSNINNKSAIILFLIMTVIICFFFLRAKNSVTGINGNNNDNNIIKIEE